MQGEGQGAAGDLGGLAADTVDVGGQGGRALVDRKSCVDDFGLHALAVHVLDLGQLLSRDTQSTFRQRRATRQPLQSPLCSCQQLLTPEPQLAGLETAGE